MQWRLVDDLAAGHTAVEQMAYDAALLDAVIAGAPPVLRVYRWSPPALTIGRHQRESDIDVDRCADSGIQVARRPTGGRALLHGGDLTYAVAMPIPDGTTGVLEAYAYVARGLAAGLAQLGIDAQVAQRDGTRGVACFASHEGADLAVAGRKICGSAQVQRQGALLQHGAILLERLAVNETTFLVYEDEAQRAQEARRLAEATITVGELGGPTDPVAVARAVVAGFARELGVDFEDARQPVASA